MAGFTDVMRKAFPFISVAAGLGGPLGNMAAAALGKALNVDAPDPKKITDFIAGAMATPEQRLAVQKAEQDFQLQMAELGYKNQADMEALLVEDRASARAMQTATKSWVPAVLAGAAVGTLTFCIYFLGFRAIPESGHDALLLLLGAVIVTYKDVYGYYFGSSSGSAAKTAILGDISKGNGNGH